MGTRSTSDGDDDRLVVSITVAREMNINFDGSESYHTLWIHGDVWVCDGKL